jgi:uncharacterized protein (DUF1499 family)
MSQHDNLAKEVHQLMAQLKRRTERVEETRTKLCAVLCGIATMAKEDGYVSAETETEVIAPKDDK